MLRVHSFRDETMSRILSAAFALGVLVGCDQRAEIEIPTEPTYQPVTDILQTMEWILDPATDVIWDSAGTIITAEGRRELAPTTPEGWNRVRNNAAIVAEAGNLLMVPGRAAGPEWIRYAQGLSAAGMIVMAAAEAQDPDALFDAGGQLYGACVACHDRYWISDE